MLQYTVGEIAAVFVGDNGEPPFERDFVVYSKVKERTSIHFLSSHCDPMVYPRLFPKGKDWERLWKSHVVEKRAKKRNKITMLQFYAYRFLLL